MRHHNLKTLCPYYEAVLSGNKKFEIRLNDRDFQKGDTVTLKEYESGIVTGKYTGREKNFNITYVTAFAQKEGWVVFGIKPVK